MACFFLLKIYNAKKQVAILDIAVANTTPLSPRYFDNVIDKTMLSQTVPIPIFIGIAVSPNE